MGSAAALQCCSLWRRRRQPRGVVTVSLDGFCRRKSTQGSGRLMWGLGVLPVAVKVCGLGWVGDREVEVHSVVSVWGVWVWRFPAWFCGNDGRGEAVADCGVLSCICLAPQLVCGCSTRAPLAFFLAWGGWRQRSVLWEALRDRRGLRHGRSRQWRRNRNCE